MVTPTRRSRVSIAKVESITRHGLVVEAMMAGLPVVASDWRALPEIVENEKTGFLVPVRDASATAKSLAALLSDPALRKRMGQAGRARCEDRYRVEVFQRGMEDALSSVGGTAEKVGRWEGNGSDGVGTARPSN